MGQFLEKKIELMDGLDASQASTKNFLFSSDDIQGTAACALAGLLASERITGNPPEDQKYLFLGAGEAGMGIAQLLRQQLRDVGVPNHEISSRLNFFDAEGLICSERSGTLDPDHEIFAHDLPYTKDFAEAVRLVKPTAIIGVAGAGPLFTQEVLEEMAKINDRPIIFALSNPTSKAECTAEDAYKYTDGRCVYATGSPQQPVEINYGPYEGNTWHPGQGNNVYIFPGVAMAAVLSGVRLIPSKAFLVAARTVAKSVTDEEIQRGQVYPDLVRIRDVSVDVTADVMDYIYSAPASESLASFLPEPANKREYVRQHCYDTDYAKLTPSIWRWPGQKVKDPTEGKTFSKIRM